MPRAWRIVGWRERYEVTDQGRAAKPGEDLRKSALPYVRLKVKGGEMGASYRKLKEAAGSRRRLALAYAIFCKLLELAADQVRERRGWILTDTGEPATAADIAFYTGFLQQDITRAMEALCDKSVGWVAEDTYSSLQQPTGTSKELQMPSEPKPKPKVTKPNSTDTEGEKPAGKKPPAAPVSANRDERELRGDSVSVSDKLLGSRDGIAAVILSKLQLRVNRRLKQGRADLTTLRYLADHVMHGDFGSPVDSKLEVYAKAAEIGADPNANSKMAILMAWVHKELKVGGHTWKKF